MTTIKYWGPSEINALPVQLPSTTPRWQFPETPEFEADPVCLSGHRGGRARPHHRATCTHLGGVLSHRHVGAAAGLHGEAHDLAFHEDEQQHKDLERQQQGQGSGMPSGILGDLPTDTLFPTPWILQAEQPPGPTDPPNPPNTGIPVQPIRSPTDTQASPTNTPASTEASTHILSPPHRHQGPTDTPAQPCAGAEFPADTLGRVSLEIYRQLGPDPTDTPGLASQGPHGHPGPVPTDMLGWASREPHGHPGPGSRGAPRTRRDGPQRGPTDIRRPRDGPHRGPTDTPDPAPQTLEAHARPPGRPTPARLTKLP